MLSRVVKAELIAQETDVFGYTTYVFKLVDEEDRYGFKYVMCTRWPNWNHRELKNGEVGFLHFTEIIAGKDSWFNGSTYIPYRYSNLQFDRFIIEQDKYNNKHKFKL